MSEPARLRTAGVAATVFSGVRTNPSEVEVAAAAKAYADDGCDGFLGAGGGSALDVAKSAAVVVSHGGSIVDFEDGARPVTDASAVASPAPPPHVFT